MKRGILLILMLLLLVDLSDGSLGKAKFVLNHSNTKISHTSANYGPVKANTSDDALISLHCQKIFSSIKSKPVIQRGQLAIILITACNKGRAGGIPR